MEVQVDLSRVNARLVARIAELENDKAHALVAAEQLAAANGDLMQRVAELEAAHYPPSVYAAPGVLHARDNDEPAAAIHAV